MRSALGWALLPPAALSAALSAAGAQEGARDPCAPLAWDALGAARSALEDIRAMDDRGSPEYLALNDIWMRLVRTELLRRDVDASLVPAPSGALNLALHADPRSANPAARLYGRLAARLGAGSVTVSVIETGPSDGLPNAFAHPTGPRVEIGPWAALRMLEGRKSAEALHEFRHLMFQRRRGRGVRSVLDLELRARDGAPPGTPFPHLSYEEIHNYASEAAFWAGRLGEPGDHPPGGTAEEELDDTLLHLGGLAREAERLLDGSPAAPGDARLLAEARDLASGVRERAAAARRAPVGDGGKRRAVRELRRLVHGADRRTMTGPGGLPTGTLP